MSASPQNIIELLSTIRRLPPLPHGVARLMAMNPSAISFVEEATQIVRADPALATQVLKIANSAMFAGQSEVTAVDRAIMRVGARMISTVLTEGHLRRAFDVVDDLTARLWTANSFAANFAMNAASGGALGIAPEDAYRHGLLHDVGRLVLVALFRNAVTEIVDADPHPRRDLIEQEDRHCGMSHVLAGRVLGNRWKLPAEVTLVVAAHHADRSQRGSYPAAINRIIDLLALTDEITHFVGRGADDVDALESGVEELLDRPEIEDLLEPLALRPHAAIAALRPALAAVERQKKILGIKGSRVFGAALT